MSFISAFSMFFTFRRLSFALRRAIVSKVMGRRRGKTALELSRGGPHSVFARRSASALRRASTTGRMLGLRAMPNASERAWISAASRLGVRMRYSTPFWMVPPNSFAREPGFSPCERKVRIARPVGRMLSAPA